MRVGIHPVIFLLDNGQYVIEEQVRAALSSEAFPIQNPCSTKQF